MKRWIKNRAVEIMLGTILFLFITSYGSLKGGNPGGYYKENAYEETGGKNVVAAIYLDYRLFDSILEAGILLVSASGIIFISKKDDEV